MYPDGVELKFGLYRNEEPAKIVEKSSIVEGLRIKDEWQDRNAE